MPKTPPKVDAERMQRAEEYLLAAREHYVALVQLPKRPTHYPIAYYQAGLAVACLLRAYSELVGAEHDAGHDLSRHAKTSLFWEFVPADREVQGRRDLAAVHARWLNNHRYRSLAALRKFLNDGGLFRVAGNRTVRGDVVSYNWDILLEATLSFLFLGIELWEMSKKKWSGS